jgi:hypothetical protein
MAGTGSNWKVEELAASLTVVTKAQMAEFAALDINDINADSINHGGKPSAVGS